VLKLAPFLFHEVFIIKNNMDSITIKIKDVEYIIKKSYRSLMLFEEKSGRGIDQMKDNVQDLLLLFWCILKANNKTTFLYSFDEFIDVLDDEPDSVEVFNSFLIDQAEKVVDNSEKKTENQ